MRPTAPAKPKPTPAKPKKKPAPKVKAAVNGLKTIKKGESVAPVGIAVTGADLTSGRPIEALVLVVMGLAILCFAIAAVPWATVSLRLAHYIVPHQVDLTLLGVLLFVAAGLSVLWTRGL